MIDMWQALTDRTASIMRFSESLLSLLSNVCSGTCVNRHCSYSRITVAFRAVFSIL